MEKNVGGTYTEYAYRASGKELGENDRSSWSVRVIPFAGRHLAHYQGSPNATYFMHANRLGSTSQATDYSGALAQDEIYYPWGQEWNMAGTAQEERFARLGHRDKTETGLDPTAFRMFSSVEGRWFSTDSVDGGSKNPQSFNRYAYVKNNPASRIDRFGNADCDPELDFCGCDPFDPFCGEFSFFGIIHISFNCPNNKCSCCEYYKDLEEDGPTFLDRGYAAAALKVCETFPSGCIDNCTRQCLVNYNIQNCDNLPSAIQRLYCREIKGHAKCFPTCTVEGAFLDAGITIVVPEEIFIGIRV